MKTNITIKTKITMRNFCKIGCIGLIRLYQKGISPWFPARCRFYPSCSQYTLEAIQRYGVWKGGWMGIKRICRCHPWSCGGHDPVK